MLILLSPAKTLDLTPCSPLVECTQPEFLFQSTNLIRLLRTFLPSDIAHLMKISNPLAQLNFTRYASWHLPFTLKNAKPAALMFSGDVYDGLRASTLNGSELEYAQKHLLILSGLYGVLRPMDLIQPYRLEMSMRLSNERGKDLYAFWGNLLSEYINQLINTQIPQSIINLASEEYFHVLTKKKLNANVITPKFLDQKNGRFKIISFYAKYARGLMARYAIQKNIADPQELKHFDLDGYYYSDESSNDSHWIFKRQLQRS